MSTTDGWDPKQEWWKSGTNFLVVVKHYTVKVDRSFCWDEEGEHRWCVYAFIYPKHPHYSAFEGRSIFQEATAVMPLHCGCSLMERVGYNGQETSIKVGADYNHLHDRYFTHYATPEEASEVFADASELHSWLEAKATGSEA